MAPEALALRSADMAPDESRDPFRRAKEGRHLRSVAGDRGDSYRDVVGREGLPEGFPGAPGNTRPAQREELPDDVGELLVVEQRGAEGALGGGTHDAVVDMSADPERGDDSLVPADAGKRSEALREVRHQELLLRRDRAEESLEGGIERLSPLRPLQIEAMDRLLQVPMEGSRRECAARREILPRGASS